MSASALWTIAANPRRRRKAGGRKTRTAAQRAATARMLAANRAKRGSSKRRARKSASTAVARRAPRRVSVRRSARRSASLSMRSVTGGAMGLLKAGATGAGGAVAVDVAMGFVNGFLPASMSSKVNTDGTVNYLNYAAKFGVALGLRALAAKVVSHETANRLAAGSVTVMAYELLRPMAASVLPASMSLGWYNPAMTFRAGKTPGLPGGAGMGKYQNLGNYQSTRPVMTLVSPNATAANSR